MAWTVNIQSIDEILYMEFKSLLIQFELSAFEGDRFQIDTFMPIIQVMHAEERSTFKGKQFSSSSFLSCHVTKKLKRLRRLTIESSRLIFHLTSQLKKRADTSRKCLTTVKFD